MRSRHLVALAVLFVAGTGCLPVPSLHPFVTEEQAIAVPGVVGEWADSTTRLRFTLERGAVYKITFPDSGEAAPFFRVRFARLGGRLFADVAMDAGSQPGGDPAPWLWPMHTAFRVDVAGDSLRLAFLDDEWIAGALDRRDVRVRHERPSDGIVLTEGTPGLQAMLRRIANVDAAFDTVAKFLRRR